MSLEAPGDPDALLAPSSLLSSRWSQDNLVTSDPARLYDGPVRERVDLQSLEYLIPDLEKTMGPVRLGAGRMGVFTWDVACANAEGPFVLQVPLVLDGPGRRGRTKNELPRLAVENARHFLARGLTRFLAAPRDYLTLGGDVPAAIFTALPAHRPLTFGQGAIQVESSGGKQSAVVGLGRRLTAELLAEMIAALVYHYERDLEGGTALTDVCVNDGDFVVRRRRDGSFDLRLTTARRREGGIGPNLLLLYLIQMMAYEDWSVDGKLVGLPLLVSNPSVAFAGLARGLGYRARDLGLSEEQALREVHQWVRDFGHSREGRAYRPWVERFLAGALPLSFGDDPRERWWRLIPLHKKLGFLELTSRQGAGEVATRAAGSARILRTFIDRLSAEIGRIPDADADTLPFNELGRDGLLSLLEEARVPAPSRHGLADELLARWPYRSLNQVLAEVSGAHALRKVKSRLSFGHVITEEEQATLTSLGPPPREGTAARSIANPEVFGGLPVPASLHARAVQTFPTFEAYMDAALHDEAWGYYGHGVSIGSAGHFTTSPESMSPHYGKWLSAWAYRCWKDMLAHGELTEADPFPVIEFGAGNGRLARDFLDAVAQGALDTTTARADQGRRQTFASRVDYRIYETSASLRDRQRQLVGAGASVREGDARRPAATLRRDFPDGLKGFVLSNEVPDAFGVHKVVLGPDGRARAALVIPRIEPSVLGVLARRQPPDDGLADRIRESDAALRMTFGFRHNEGDLYLDGETFGQVMAALSRCASTEAETLRAALWFEEAYVPVAAVPALAAHLRANAAQHAIALAAEDAGVVLYVNVHADRFVHQLATSLRAGVIVTIDYGDTTWGLIRGARRGDFPFRVYGEWQDYVPRPNDPYFAPGTQDMTADVNFTDLAQAGQDAGLHVLHYGPERDVIGDDLPAMLTAAARQPAIADFLGNPVFKVLVLGTRPSDLFSGPLLTALPLASGDQEVPKSKRERIAIIVEQISAQESYRD